MNSTVVLLRINIGQAQSTLSNCNHSTMSLPSSIQEEAEKAAFAGNANRLKHCLAAGTRLDTFVYLKALQNGDIGTFQVVLDNGGDVNYDLGSSGTPLINALRHHHEASLEFLLAKGANPSDDRWGHILPPLGVAVRFNKDIKWTERLLQAGAKLDESGALHVAAIRGDLAKMRLFLQYEVNVNEVPKRTISAFVQYTKKGSPVHWAIAGGSTDAVQLLLEYHPDLSVLDEDGTSVRDQLREAQYGSGGI